MRPSSPLVIIFLGPPGSGKGTQAKKLAEKFALNIIDSGGLLRSRKQTQDFSGRKIASYIDAGYMAPSAVVFKLWLDELEKFKQRPDFKGVVFEGSPRKMLEAQILDQALEWYELDKNVQVIFIKVSEPESIKRLLLRAKIEHRDDDNPKAIAQRWQLFTQEVLPIVEHYRSKGRLREVKGEQSIEAVFADILQLINHPPTNK